MAGFDIVLVIIRHFLFYKPIAWIEKQILERYRLAALQSCLKGRAIPSHGILDGMDFLLCLKIHSIPYAFGALEFMVRVHNDSSLL